MKKLFLLIIILCIGYNVSAQKQERRVYFLDVTESMKGYVSRNKPRNPSTNIWDDVCKNLKEAIDNVHDETTELVVVPFSDKTLNASSFSARATNEGKEYLKNQIDNLKTYFHFTDLSIPIDHFYKLLLSNNRDVTTYMFLMTDGTVSIQYKEKFHNLLGEWEEKFAHQHVYGFYVMLNENAIDHEVSNIIDGEKHLWRVNTADVNINIIKLEDKATFNIRNESFVDIPIRTTIGKVNAKFNITTTDKDYQIDKVTQQNGNLRIYISTQKDRSLLPDVKKIMLKVTATPNDEYTFVVTDTITLTCKNEKEYTLKVTVK